ncbi:MAG: acetyltransferase [Deltaproteobacteria bacterium]|nr:MAG: acetyltransferase [Deltaproteobacteria bacterium]
MADRLLVFGASGHGKVVADVAMAAGWDVVGFADDNPDRKESALLEIPVVAIGVAEAVLFCRREDAHAIVGIGNNQARRQVQSRLHDAGVAVATLIHPRAILSPSARVGTGAVVVAGAVINCETVVGQGSIINTGATVDHDCRLGDFVHVSPGAHLGGTVTVGDDAHIGIGAVVVNNVGIGAGSIVGAGAAVVSSIPAGVVAYGVPARVRRSLRP